MTRMCFPWFAGGIAFIISVSEPVDYLMKKYSLCITMSYKMMFLCQTLSVVINAVWDGKVQQSLFITACALYKCLEIVIACNYFFLPQSRKDAVNTNHI